MQEKKNSSFFAQWPGVLCICTAAVLLVLYGAVRWYPALYQPAYQPVASAPFFAIGARDAININTATTADLTALPGIGEVKATAIVAYREENGPFATVEELLQVHGIGPSTLENILEFVFV